ncbi:12522_t:CDS:1, partial [Acaulospora colombiana]
TKIEYYSSSSSAPVSKALLNRCTGWVTKSDELVAARLGTVKTECDEWASFITALRRDCILFPPDDLH